VIDTATVTPSDQATVSMENTNTGGAFLVVQEAYLPEGGFVTIHDSTVTDGAVFDSIRGSSDYLEPGTHSNVHVKLDEPFDGSDTPVPMAHTDTNDNQEYDFPDTEGGEDGPYTTGSGDPVIDTGLANVSAAVSTGDYESDGNSYTVHHVDLSEGGFVTIHDASLFGGAVFESVIGTSEYLEPGFHADVEVTLDDPMRTSQTVVPMAHTDTNGNEAYDFVTSEGAEDGPYATAAGDPVVDTARSSVTAQVTFTGAEDVEDTVTVDSVTLLEGGFVTLHDSTLLDGTVLDSVRGSSEYLGPGTHENVEITLEEPLEDDDTVFAMAHRDSNGNQAYDFVADEGAADGPYVAAGAPVMGAAELTVESDMDGSDDMDTETPEDGMDDSDDMDDGTETESMDDSSDDEAPGFGAVVALIALLAAAMLAVRRQ